MSLFGYGVAPMPEGELLSPPAADSSEEQVLFRRYRNATIFKYFYTAFFFCWLAVPVINAIFIHDYVQFGSPPSPGPFASSRYSLEWWMWWFMTLNLLIPYAFSFALVNNFLDEAADAHYFIAKNLSTGMFIPFILFTVLWFVGCNNAGSGGAMVCNDYRYCGVFWPNVWCPNRIGFSPQVASSDLSRNMEGTLTWAFSLVFVLLNKWNSSFNMTLRRKGVLQN